MMHASMHANVCCTSDLISTLQVLLLSNYASSEENIIQMSSLIAMY